MLKAMAGHLARARRLDLPKQGKVRAILKGHWAILDAIEAGDPAGAQEAIRRHLAGTVGRIETLQGEHPDYFQPACARRQATPRPAPRSLRRPHPGAAPPAHHSSSHAPRRPRRPWPPAPTTHP